MPDIKQQAIAHLLLGDGIEPLFPYKRPMTKRGFFKKHEYAYDEYYDCYICPKIKSGHIILLTEKDIRNIKAVGYSAKTVQKYRNAQKAKNILK